MKNGTFRRSEVELSLEVETWSGKSKCILKEGGRSGSKLTVVHIYEKVSTDFLERWLPIHSRIALK